jgi:3-carboxy-cis,cis-muconate cycloisomerase
LVAIVLSAMVQEHERALGGWPAEWDTVPELVSTTASSAAAIAGAIEELVVDTARMRSNLDATHGLNMAEAVAMRLSERVGKQEAHQIVEAAAGRAIDERRELLDVLSGDPRVAGVLDRSELARLLSPETYLGSAGAFVRRALDAVKVGDRA